MGVSQTDGIKLRRHHRNIAIFVDIRPLLHTTVDENVLTAGLQQGTGAGDLMGST